MPYAVINQNSGTYATTTGTSAALPSTTAGTTVILVLTGSGSQPAPTTLTGWTQQSPTNTSLRIYTRATAGGETAWPLSQLTATVANWAAFEVDGLDTAGLVDAKPSLMSTGSGTSIDTFGSGTNLSSTTYDGLVLTCHHAQMATSTVPTWSGHTQGLVEVLAEGAASGATASGLSVAMANSTGPTTYDVAATCSVSAGASQATHIVFACAGSPRAPMFDFIFGGEIGTAAGLFGTAGQSPWDAGVGSPAVVSGDPLATGTYCLELSAAAAVEWVAVAAAGALGLYGAVAATVVFRVALWFPSALPAGDTVLFSGVTGANNIVIRYVSASQKLGVKVGAGTEVLSAATLAADTRYGLDARMIASTTAATCDWQLDRTAQTQATGTTSAAVYTTPFQVGWTAATTATVRMDDFAVSHIGGQYPIGDIRVYGLGPDPAGTLTASTTADFQTFTANGTTAAWNAAAALAAIDDIPPTLGASADGLVQAVSSATDFVAVPMATRDAASNGQVIRAVRWYFPGWAASTTAATIGFRGFDGTTETVLWAAADPNFDNTSTPGWVCRMHRTIGSAGPRVITQTQLDAMTARIGFGNAAVKVGVHAVLAEVAMRADPLTVRVAEVTGLEGVTSTAFVDARLDPDSAAVIGYDATPAPDFDSTVSYVERTVPTSTSLPAGAAVATEVVGADTVDDVTQISIGPA